MYVPAHFRFDDPDKQLEFMRQYAFATLVASIEGKLEIAQIPLLIDREGARMVLHGHVARRNPMVNARSIAAIFHGPHAYISARWYHQPDMVPTWHYLTVHAHGTLTPITDPGQERQLFERLGAVYEGDQAKVWWRELSDHSYEHFRAAILWFRIEVEEIVGKAKLGQDDSDAGRAGVVAALRTQGGEYQLAIARAMEELSSLITLT